MTRLADESEEDEDGEQGIQEKLSRRTFVVASRNLLSQPQWVSVSEVFRTANDAELLERAGIESFKDPRFQKYSDRLKKLRAIKQYPYVVHVLERAMSYEEVTEIFVRVNSLGAKLRSSDLALAQMTSRWPNLLKQLEAFQEECEQSWFTIDLGQLVRAIVVFATQQCLFRSVAATPVEKLQEGWEEAKEGLRFAINFLRTNAGIEDESLLSSPMFIHALAAVSRIKDNKLTAAEQRALLHWLLVANARGRYSRGSTETLLNEDLAILFRTGDVAALIEPVKRQFGRLHVEPGDLAGRGVNSPLFSLAYLALKAAGAKDWYSGLGIVADASRQAALHPVASHHPEVAAQGAGLRDRRDQRDRQHGLHHRADQPAHQQQGCDRVPGGCRRQAGRRGAEQPVRSDGPGFVGHGSVPGLPVSCGARSWRCG